MKTSAMQLAFGFEISQPMGDARGRLSAAQERGPYPSENPATIERRGALEKILERDPFPVSSPAGGATAEERGQVVMREIVRWVERNGPESYALLEMSRTPDQLCGSHCEIYHYSPEPNAAAFTRWIANGEAYRDLDACGKYRFTFASMVCGSLRVVAELREEEGLDYSIDDTGAVVPPESFRPEDALLESGVYDGCNILQATIRRGPRLYMDDPSWYGENGAIARKARKAKIPRDMRRVRLGQGIHVWLELEPSPAFLQEVALEKQGVKTSTPGFQIGG